MDYFNHNTFATYYKTAEFLFENAKKSEEGQFYNLISSISFCAFSIEAYINHQGLIEDKQWKEWDKNEHPTLKSKIKKLAKIIGFNIDLNDEVFSIITPLFKFRDIIVHGHTELVAKKVKNPQNNSNGALLNLSSNIENFCSIKNAENILNKTKKIILEINKHSTFKIAESRLFSLGNGSFQVKRT